MLCSKCGEEKEAAAFHRGHVCDACQKEYRRQYHFKNKDKRNAYCRKYHKKNKDVINVRHGLWRKDNANYVRVKDQERYDKAREFIDAAKDKPCTDCNQNFPSCVMDFDHVRGTKSFQIAWSLKRYTLARIQQEMNKCELVCANCHRIRTHITKKR